MLVCCSHMCFDSREEHGPHVWVGDLELATPTAAFGKSANHQQQDPKFPDAVHFLCADPPQMQVAE